MKPLTWTTARPHCRGWWFWRNVVTRDMGCRYVADPGAVPLGLQWAGPVPEPGERT